MTHFELLAIAYNSPGLTEPCTTNTKAAVLLPLSPPFPPSPGWGNLLLVGKGGSRVQAGGGLRSEGVARLPDVMEQAGLKGALCWQQSPRALPAPSAPHAGSSRQLRAAATLPDSVGLAFCLLFYFPFFFPLLSFSPPFLPPKELGRREHGWS